MSNIVFTDDFLRSAAAEVREVMLRTLPAPSECSHEFSGGFKAKMETLIRRMELRDSLRRLGRSAAAVFLALIVSLSGWLAVDADARADFMSWAREVYESSIIYRYFGGEKALTELPDVELGWLPEGYVEVVRDADEESCVIVYESENDTIVLTVFLTQDGLHSEYLFGNIEYVYRSLEINGMDAELYLIQDGSSSNELTWFDAKNGVAFQLSTYLSETDMLHIAESANLSE